MFLSTHKPLHLALLVVTVLVLAGFTAFAQSGPRSSRTTDVADVVLNPDQYVGKRVTVQWKIDRVYSPTAIGLEKNEHHLLVVSVPPATLSTGDMKKGEPFTATGIVENFDRAKFEREYGNLDYGKAPLDKFDNKPVLVVTGAKSAKLQKPQASVSEPQNPSTAEPGPASLPRTASPLPALGFVGLLSLTLGLGLPLLRRQ
ncbi:MAG: hypothetical protein C5B58_16065 [Acidobacteria bacterium]|nr:MAG: hypothetical protein C5B58_16065 [Acidobacteriota bacterium]